MASGIQLLECKWDLARLLIEDGVAPINVAEEVGCSRCTIFNYKRNLRDFGDCLVLSISMLGRPSTITDGMIKVITASWLEWRAIPSSFFSRIHIWHVGFEDILGCQAQCISWWDCMVLLGWVWSHYIWIYNLQDPEKDSLEPKSGTYSVMSAGRVGSRF